MIDRRYYVNVNDLMRKHGLQRPRKRKPTPPIISIEVGLWSPITWL